MQIKIGKVIQRLRKERNLTQEQLAKFIGVSTPAVSKWESGNSYPDIELLPLLADFFNVSIDKLLNYKIDLSEEEVMKIYKELESGFARIEIDLSTEEPKEEFRQDLESVKKLSNMYIEKYPKSYLLKLRICSLYQMYSYKFGKSELNDRVKETTNILEDIVRNTDDIQIKETALIILSNAYCMLEDYEKAELYLNMIHKSIGDTSVNLAMIYLKQNRLEEAEILLQNKLFSNVFNISMDCKGIINVYKNQYKELKKKLENRNFNKNAIEREMEYIKNKLLGYANLSLEIKKMLSEDKGAFFSMYVDYMELSLIFLFFNMKEEAKKALYSLKEILEKYPIHESLDVSQMRFFDKVESKNLYTFNIYTNLLIVLNDDSYNELREEPIFKDVIEKILDMEKMLKNKE
ncbi:TPA: helix-turn-helix domain-containing protein [Clostridioides difficile]|uniref:helix-turn-helix transcriptional regulator n=1 Tax=Clostridioides difficile TaxID=1496 RepID=UPI00038CBA16|nr:helix-turn-helix transcriptional regulator [Clostridioides difficile]EGT5399219.1 XRE family transcriptional regulator [Clostridioides difficile]EII6782095.1 helix-turn-helix transcriptional regulator [Clostridioides difficile]EIS9525542.1 helix-turn-helix transcriptional regulator [Clostridioides difficile]EIS9627030.1 helix-turn-helix transcriptional regulator [Clostridioides difficile]EJX3462443.1 helix-turn-helix transcriptional regulator [Clostridioides difficile]